MKQTLLPISFLFFLSICFCKDINAQVVKYHRIEAKLSKEKFEEVKQAGLEIDHYHFHDGVLHADVSSDDIYLLKSKSVKVKYIIKDLEKNIHKRNAKIDKAAAKTSKTRIVTVPTPTNFGIGGTYGTTAAVAKHFTFQEMQNELDDMRALYPNLISVKTSIGTTEQSRGIFMVRISDNPDVDESEPEILMNAIHHAREPISMTQLIFFMWHLLENYNTDKEIKQLVNSSELYIVPCVNPDGYVYNQTTNSTGGGLWRKNRRNNGGGAYGVDPNRNYDHDFGGLGTSSTPSSDIYKGPSAFSEPETQAIRDLANAHQFVTAFHNHSYGNYCIFPYSNVNVNTCPEIPLFNQLSIFLTTDNSFIYGNAYQTVAYSAAGGAEDWGYAEQTTKPKTYGFTPEIGLSSDGFWPASSRIIPLCNSMIVMNKNLMKVSTKFATTTSTATTFNSLSASLPFNIKSFCINPSTYTVSIVPISPLVTSTSAPKVFSNMTMFQTLNDAFTFSVNASIAVGTNVYFELITDNGYYARKDTISILYNCPTPISMASSSITSSSANLSWGAIAGVTNYKVSYKIATATAWSTDINVVGNSTTINLLIANTSYNWRVKIATCSNYSSTQNFATFPICGIPSPNITSTSTNSFSISWAAIIGATSYNVQYSIIGSSSWTNISVPTTSAVISTLLPGTIYEFEVRANCGAGSGPYSTTQPIATNPAVVYCTSFGNNNSNEWIDHIQLGSINRNSNQEVGGYINTGLSTSLSIGGNYTLVFSAGYNQNIQKQNWRVYIDFNGDGDFADLGENIVSTMKPSNGTYSSVFIVPTNALIGVTRMRVQMIQGNSIITSPCGVFANGEVEDYTIKIMHNSAFKGVSDSKNDLNGELLVEVSPNPFNDQIYISLLENNRVDKTIIQLFDAHGKMISSEKLNANISSHQINTSYLPQGFYILSIQNGTKDKMIKLVK